MPCSASSCLSTLVLVWIALAVPACGDDERPKKDTEEDAVPPAATQDGGDAWAAPRERMVRETIEARGVDDARVVAAMRTVPRHRFVPERHRELAYEDRALPIGDGQTISQPYIVAIMAQEAHIGPNSRVLEIGTGSGYGAAVLSRVAKHVCTIEILKSLGERASKLLGELGYDNVKVRVGDGYQGWAEEGPFDAIVVTAAPPEVPEPLKEQLKVGGRLVIPVGTRVQHLRVITRTRTGYREEPLFRVRFVPMTGEAAK